MQKYIWPKGYNSAFAFTIDVDAESPQIWRSRETGIKGLNQLEQRRYGLREGIFNLLDVLERFEVKATCFVPCFEAETRPWLLETIVSRGHEVALHGYYHEVPGQLPTARFREITEKCIEFFQKNLGKKPVGFRSPSWEMTGSSLAVLRDLGLSYDSSVSGYNHPYELDGLMEMPIQWSLDDAVFIRYVGGGVDSAPPRFTKDVIEGWIDVSSAICAHGGLAVSTVHPWLTGRPGRLHLAEKLLEHFRKTPGVWMPTMQELATYHESSANKDVFAESTDVPGLPEGYI